VSSRTVEPLGLVLKAGVWYLAARSSAGLRTYRVSNVLESTVSDDAFDRPADFDLAAWWLASTQRFEKASRTGHAELRVSPSGLKLLRHLGTEVTLAADVDVTTVDATGWIRVTIPIESIPHAASQLLRLGPEAEVLKPAALRRELVERVAAIAALYRDDDA